MTLRRCLAGACLLFVGVLALGGTGSSPARGQGGGCAADQFGAVAGTNSTDDGAISGDGAKIAFTRTGPNIGGITADELVVANYDGTNEQIVASTHEGTTAVSMIRPELNYDGSVVAVGWRPAGTTNLKSFAVMSVASPSDIEVHHGFQPRLSNDGTKVAARHIASGHLPGVTVYDLAAGTEVFIEEGPDQRIYSSDLSGDGTTLAYGRRDTVGVSSTYRVAVVDVASQTEIDLIDDAAFSPLNISDDGSTVFFYSYAANSHAVRQGGTDALITSMGVPQTRFGVTHQNFGYYNEVMSADGSKIVYTAELEDPYRTVFIEQIDVATDSVSASLYLEDPAAGFVRHMETSADGAASILPSYSALLAGASGNFYRWSACTGGMPPAPTATATPLPSPETPTSVTLDYETGQGTDGVPKLRATWVGVNDSYEIEWLRSGSSVLYETVAIEEATLALAPYPPAAGQNEWCVRVSGIVDTNTSSPSAPVCFDARVCDDFYVTVRLLDGDTPTIGDDVIQGTNGNDFIEALDGNDRVCALAGDDTVDAGAGNDHIFGGGGADVIDGGSGGDRILGGSGEDDIDGGPGKDVLFGNGENDTIEGGGGVDRIRGGTGDDTLTGGPAVDRLFGDENNDTLIGGGGNDYMYGGDGDDEIDGKQGALDRAFGGADNDFCTAEEQSQCENIRCGVSETKFFFDPPFIVDFDCEHLTENLRILFNKQRAGREDRDLDTVKFETVTQMGIDLVVAYDRYTTGDWALDEPYPESDGRLRVYVRPGITAPGFSPPNNIQIDSKEIKTGPPSADFLAHELFHQFQWRIETITNYADALGPSTSWLEGHAEYATCAYHATLPTSGYCRDSRRRTKYFTGTPEEKPWNPGGKNYEGVNFYRFIESIYSDVGVINIVKTGSDHETGLLSLLSSTACGGQTCYHDLHDWRTLTSPDFDSNRTVPDRTIAQSADTGGAVLLDVARSSGTVAIVHEGASPIDVSVISDTGPSTNASVETGVPCSSRGTTTTANDAGIMFVEFSGCVNARVVATNVGTDESSIIMRDVTDVLPAGPAVYSHHLMITIVDGFNAGTVRGHGLCVPLGLDGFHLEPAGTNGEIVSPDDWDVFVSCWGGTVNVLSLEAAVDATEGDENLCVKRNAVTITVAGTHREFTFSTAPCL